MGSVVGLVVFKQPCVFGCSLRWELERCAVPVSDSTLVALVEVPVSLVVSPSSSITKVLSKVCQTNLLGFPPRDGQQLFSQLDYLSYCGGSRAPDRKDDSHFFTIPLEPWNWNHSTVLGVKEKKVLIKPPFSRAHIRPLEPGCPGEPGRLRWNLIWV